MVFLVWILRTNHILFPYRQCGLAGVMLLRIPSSQNFFWKMASPSWVSLSDILFLSFWFCQFCPFPTPCSACLLFNMHWALIFRQLTTLRVTLFISFSFFFFLFLISYILLTFLHFDCLFCPQVLFHDIWKRLWFPKHWPFKLCP